MGNSTTSELRKIGVIQPPPVTRPLHAYLPLPSPFYLTTNHTSMDLELLIVTSLTTEPDNLTALHQNSGLQTTYESRRTETGFLIREDRLPRCVTLPASNIPTRSWIWDQGVLLGYRDKHNEILRYWLCRTCYDSQVPYPLSTYLKNVEKNTNKALDHL
jgi:hypothetical protein